MTLSDGKAEVDYQLYLYVHEKAVIINEDLNTIVVPPKPPVEKNQEDSIDENTTDLAKRLA